MSRCFLLMRRRPPRSTRTDTLFPYTTLFRSVKGGRIREAAIPRMMQLVKDKLGLQRWSASDCSLERITSRNVPKLAGLDRSEEHTSELQSLMRISYAVFCLKKKKYRHHTDNTHNHDQQVDSVYTHTH